MKLTREQKIEGLFALGSLAFAIGIIVWVRLGT